jgi:hypothetical protein
MGLLLLKVEWINSTPQVNFCPDPQIDKERSNVCTLYRYQEERMPFLEWIKWGLRMEYEDGGGKHTWRYPIKWDDGIGHPLSTGKYRTIVLICQGRMIKDFPPFVDNECGI